MLILLTGFLRPTETLNFGAVLCLEVVPWTVGAGLLEVVGDTNISKTSNFKSQIQGNSSGINLEIFVSFFLAFYKIFCNYHWHNERNRYSFSSFFQVIVMFCNCFLRMLAANQLFVLGQLCILG